MAEAGCQTAPPMSQPSHAVSVAASKLVGPDTLPRQYMPSTRSAGNTMVGTTLSRGTFAAKPASVHEMTEEQKFTTAFSAAINEAEKNKKF